MTVPGTLPLPRLSGLLLGRAALALVVLSSGCRDALTDPVPRVVTEETRAALAVETAIPSLPGVVEGLGAAEAAVPDDRLLRWTGAWQASWLAPPGEGAAARSRLYDRAAAPLAEALGPEGVRRTVEEVEAVMAATRGADLARLPEDDRRRVEDAVELASRARSSLEAGRAAAALRVALEAGDRLRRLSPRTVAEGLVERAEEARRRNPEVGTYSQEERDRIARLVRNARYALDRGRYPLAIQRAYYACRLLGVELP